MTGTAAALLATQLLGGIGNLAAVLGAGRALTLGGEILEDIQVNDVVVGFYSEHFFVQNHFLSGYGSVNLQNVQFHN